MKRLIVTAWVIDLSGRSQQEEYVPYLGRVHTKKPPTSSHRRNRYRYLFPTPPLTPPHTPPARGWPYDYCLPPFWRLCGRGTVCRFWHSGGVIPRTPCAFVVYSVPPSGYRRVSHEASPLRNVKCRYISSSQNKACRGVAKLDDLNRSNFSIFSYLEKLL